MKAHIKIEMDNDAFANGNGDELARILQELAETLEGCELEGGEDIPLFDANGNSVGSFATTRTRRSKTP